MRISHDFPGFKNPQEITALSGGRLKRYGIWGNLRATFAEAAGRVQGAGDAGLPVAT